MDSHRFLLWVILVFVLTGVAGCVTARQRAWEHYSYALESASYGNWEQCKQEFERSLAMGVELPGVRADYAILLYKMGYPEAALEQLRIEERNYPLAQPLVERIRAAMQAKKLQLPPAAKSGETKSHQPGEDTSEEAKEAPE